MRQTAINCTERTGKPTTTRNVTAAISAACRWTPPAWCEDSAMETAHSKENNTIRKTCTHRVFETYQTWQTTSETARRHPGFEAQKTASTGDARYQGIPAAN
ncbi:hypothetical protein L1S32_08715 [Methanogenium sp. S4BF]|uniref:hypothetical protein n=1 Tax=Methanogenium sp. S4BF TaxID=1789226 RepID=UPI0024172F72|nr:hypothetical protein [Methanogenium sp. S4BF]WFN33923.1 hypothetical protein L1S32_08715 [Methanogenium sp. S4BF]